MSGSNRAAAVGHPVDFLDCEWCVTPQEHADAARAAAPPVEPRKVEFDVAVDVSTTEAVERFDIPARGQPKNVSPDSVAGLREQIISAMPWYDESDPDYTELDAVLLAALLAEPVPLDVERTEEQWRERIEQHLGPQRRSIYMGRDLDMMARGAYLAARLTDPKGATDGE